MCASTQTHSKPPINKMHTHSFMKSACLHAHHYEMRQKKHEKFTFCLRHPILVIKSFHSFCVFMRFQQRRATSINSLLLFLYSSFSFVPFDSIRSFDETAGLVRLIECVCFALAASTRMHVQRFYCLSFSTCLFGHEAYVVMRR